MKLTPIKSLCLMLISTAFTTHAAINLDRTRIVFPESDKASSLKVDNQSKALPYLALSGLKMKRGKKKIRTLWRFPHSTYRSGRLVAGKNC